MRDVFLSYACEDQQRARLLVDALEQQGYPVWWDRQILPSQNWPRAIAEVVREAKCVVVLWSPDSVRSDWVLEEASFAREQEKLLPVLLEDAEIPLPFRLIQTADLRGWEGQGDDPRFRQFAAGVRACVERAVAAGGPVRPPGREKAGGRRGQRLRARLMPCGWVLLPSLILGLCALILMHWPAPTVVDIDAIATRFRFQSRGDVPQVLLEPPAAQSLALREFEEVRLPGGAVTIGNPAEYNLRRDSYPDSAWTTLPYEPFLIFRPAGVGAATLTIQTTGRPADHLALDRVFTGPAEVTLESRERGNLMVRLRGGKQSGAVSLPEEFRIVADFCAKQGDPLPYARPSATLTIRLQGRGSRLLEFTSGQSGILLAMEYPPDRKESLLGRTTFAVSQVEFLDQGPDGREESTIDGPGLIRYSRYPGIEPAPLNKRDFLVLGDLGPFQLQEVALADSGGGLRIRLHGVAGMLSSGPAGFLRDRRLSRFEMLKRSPTLAPLFTILVWLVPTLAAARRFVRGLALQPGSQPR